MIDGTEEAAIVGCSLNLRMCFQADVARRNSAAMATGASIIGKNGSDGGGITYVGNIAAGIGRTQFFFYIISAAHKQTGDAQYNNDLFTFRTIYHMDAELYKISNGEIEKCNQEELIINNKNSSPKINSIRSETMGFWFCPNLIPVQLNRGQIVFFDIFSVLL